MLYYKAQGSVCDCLRAYRKLIWICLFRSCFLADQLCIWFASVYQQFRMFVWSNGIIFSFVFGFAQPACDKLTCSNSPNIFAIKFPKDERYFIFFLAHLVRVHFILDGLPIPSSYLSLRVQGSGSSSVLRTRTLFFHRFIQMRPKNRQAQKLVSLSLSLPQMYTEVEHYDEKVGWTFYKTIQLA